jgi:hypothetical protein
MRLSPSNATISAWGQLRRLGTENYDLDKVIKNVIEQFPPLFLSLGFQDIGNNPTSNHYQFSLGYNPVMIFNRGETPEKNCLWMNCWLTSIRRPPSRFRLLHRHP